MRHNIPTISYCILYLFISFLYSCNSAVNINFEEKDLIPVRVHPNWLKKNLNVLLYKKYGIKRSEFLLISLLYRASLSKDASTLHLALHPVWLEDPNGSKGTKTRISELFCIGLDVRSPEKPELKSVFLKKKENEKSSWKKFSGNRIVLFRKDKLESGSLPISVNVTIDPKNKKIFPGVYSDLPGENPELLITYQADDAKIITGFTDIIRTRPDDDKPFGFFKPDVWEEHKVQSVFSKNEYFDFEIISDKARLTIWPP